MINSTLRPVSQSWLKLRSLLYTLEGFPLPYLNQIITGNKNYTPSQSELKDLLMSANDLLAVDNQDMIDGFYPLKALLPDQKAKTHIKRLGEIISDSLTASWRRRHGETKRFTGSALQEINKFPDYYKRNFHHQTDGYLSPKSADLYEHQVELLFQGLANPMRRRLLKPMKKQLPPAKGPIKILELGAGCGTFTRLLSYTFPNAKITALDISPYYIQHARKKYSYKKNIDFIQGLAEDLDFKNESFDAVVSVFLLHELPSEIREKVLSESLRVLKRGGFCGHLDSLQIDDNKSFNWALENFPLTFHEPFYKNYILSPLKDIFKNLAPDKITQEEYFYFSKIIYLS